MIIILIAVIATYSVGMYLVYRHWRQTPPDAFLKDMDEHPAS